MTTTITCARWCTSTQPPPGHEDHICWSDADMFAGWPRTQQRGPFNAHPPHVNLGQADPYPPEIWIDEIPYSAAQARLIAASILRAAAASDNAAVPLFPGTNVVVEHDLQVRINNALEVLADVMRAGDLKDGVVAVRRAELVALERALEGWWYR